MTPTEKKIFKCKVWTPSVIHFECNDADTALNLASRFFSNTQQSCEFIVEVDRDDVPDEMIYSEKHCPVLIIN